jgi:hypothetical protein
LFLASSGFFAVDPEDHFCEEVRNDRRVPFDGIGATPPGMEARGCHGGQNLPHVVTARFLMRSRLSTTVAVRLILRS